MLNDIPELQNTELQIKRLAAQRFIYSTAKRAQIAQLVLAIPFTIFFSILGLFIPTLAPWQAIYGVSVLVIEAILDHWQKHQRKQAAKIQELFDCDVLGLDWNELEIGSKPDVETVIEGSNNYLRKVGNVNDLVNWYPPVVGNLSIHLARLICQRTNLRWDFQLRRWFAQRALTLTAIVILLLLIFSLWNQLSLERFVLSVLAPALPVFSWGFREYQKQNEVADELERLKSQVEEYWNDAIRSKISVHQTENKSRALQDKIFDLRKDSPLIFDAVYKYFRMRYELLATKGAEELVQEAVNYSHA
jgi:hypothetical protein